MNTRQFALQIDWLLLTGAIEGNQLLTLYQQFKRYQQGAISDAAMQTAIDDFDPDLAVQPCWETDLRDLE